MWFQIHLKLSVVPNVILYNPINEYDGNQINMDSSQISVIPSLDIINETIKNNDLAKTSNDNIRVVPNIIYSPIPPNYTDQSINISIIPAIYVIQNNENNNFEQF